MCAHNWMLRSAFRLLFRDSLLLNLTNARISTAKLGRISWSEARMGHCAIRFSRSSSRRLVLSNHSSGARPLWHMARSRHNVLLWALCHPNNRLWKGMRRWCRRNAKVYYAWGYTHDVPWSYQWIQDVWQTCRSRLQISQETSWKWKWA